MPDIANELANMLKADFKWLVFKKDQINIESKIKNVRFIGEPNPSSLLIEEYGNLITNLKMRY